LLDEITETPIRFQAKLLRLLEQQEFERVGGNDNIKVDVRIISTTNKDLLQEIQAGRFREDLYYRLSATRLMLPPLRQRKDDLVELVWYFVNMYARESQRSIKELDPTMLEIFASYSWPGNVRQLRNVVRTSLILGAGETLSLADVYWLFDGVSDRPATADSVLPEVTQGGALAPQGVGLGLGSMLQDAEDLGGLSLEIVERRAIIDTLRRTAGNRKKAAEVLGISDRTLRERIRRYKEQECLVPT
jgi:two-component system response regulator FlrC